MISLPNSVGLIKPSSANNNVKAVVAAIVSGTYPTKESVDGITWSADNNFAGGVLSNGIIHQNSKFYVTSFDGKLWSAPDSAAPLTWTWISSPGATPFILSSNGSYFLSFRNTASNCTYYKSPDSTGTGVWTTITIPGSNFQPVGNTVIWTGTQWVVFTGTGQCFVSSNGTTWTSATGASAPAALDYFNSFYLLANTFSGTNYILQSTALSSYSIVLTTSPDLVQGISHNSTCVVAVATSGKIWRSTDGTTWAPQTSPTSTDLNDVQWVASLGLFIATGSSPGKIITSPDGITWTVRLTGGGSDSIYTISD